MLERFPAGLVSVVSDSYDVYNAVSNIWGDELREHVVDRANKGCLVIRPDSGDPSLVVVKVTLNLISKQHLIYTDYYQALLVAVHYSVLSLSPRTTFRTIAG